MIHLMTARKYQPTPTGTRIRKFRQQAGLTQEQLAKKMGSAQAIISDIERGKLRAHAELIAKFAKALGVSADELVGLKKTNNAPAPTSRRISKRLQALEELPLNDQKAVCKLIDAFVAQNAGKAS